MIHMMIMIGINALDSKIVYILHFHKRFNERQLANGRLSLVVSENFLLKRLLYVINAYVFIFYQ